MPSTSERVKRVNSRSPAEPVLLPSLHHGAPTVLHVARETDSGREWRQNAVSLKPMAYHNETKARALAAFRLGNSANRTAQIVGVSPDTCERWRRDFDAGGLLRSNSEEIALKADALISDALDYIATQGPE